MNKEFLENIYTIFSEISKDKRYFSYFKLQWASLALKELSKNTDIEQILIQTDKQIDGWADPKIELFYELKNDIWEQYKKNGWWVEGFDMRDVLSFVYEHIVNYDEYLKEW